MGPFYQSLLPVSVTNSQCGHPSIGTFPTSPACCCLGRSFELQVASPPNPALLTLDLSLLETSFSSSTSKELSGSPAGNASNTYSATTDWDMLLEHSLFPSSRLSPCPPTHCSLALVSTFALPYSFFLYSQLRFNSSFKHVPTATTTFLPLLSSQRQLKCQMHPMVCLLHNMSQTSKH